MKAFQLTVMGSNDLTSEAHRPAGARTRPNSLGGKSRTPLLVDAPLACCLVSPHRSTMATTHLFLQYPRDRLGSEHPVIRLNNVEDRVVRVASEFSWRVRQCRRLRLQLLSQLRDREDPAVSKAITMQLFDAHLKVLPEIPIMPSGHMLAENVQPYSSWS